MRFIVCLLVLLTGTSAAFATHISGGYIRVAPIAGQPLTYQITVTMYYNLLTGSSAAQAATELTVCFGDNGSSQQVKQTVLATQGLSYSEYTTTHTYSGPGVYSVQAIAINRNDNIRNIQGGASAAQPFSLKTTMQIGDNLQNRTPLLTAPAALTAALNQRMTLPLSATDTEGDSLSFSLAFPLTSPMPNGSSADGCSGVVLVPAYQFPNDVKQTGTFRLATRTGLLTWDVPTEQGLYAVAIIVSERRNGVMISQTQQELLLTVIDRGGAPVTPPAYEPAQLALITAIPDVDIDGMLLRLSPNPATGDVVQADLLLSQSQTVTMELLDNQGRVYKTVRIDQPSEHHQQSFDLVGKPAGLYLIRAESGGKQVVRKVLRQ